jgi:hypothetical protein
VVPSVCTGDDTSATLVDADISMFMTTTPVRQAHLDLVSTLAEEHEVEIMIGDSIQNPPDTQTFSKFGATSENHKSISHDIMAADDTLYVTDIPHNSGSTYSGRVACFAELSARLGIFSTRLLLDVAPRYTRFLQSSVLSL